MFICIFQISFLDHLHCSQVFLEIDIIAENHVNSDYENVYIFSLETHKLSIFLSSCHPMNLDNISLSSQSFFVGGGGI